MAKAQAFRNRWITDPVLKGEYPELLLERFAPATPPVEDGDLDAIATPLDFLGINYYTRAIVRADPATGEPVTIERDETEADTDPPCPWVRWQEPQSDTQGEEACCGGRAHASGRDGRARSRGLIEQESIDPKIDRGEMLEKC